MKKLTKEINPLDYNEKGLLGQTDIFDLSISHEDNYPHWIIRRDDQVDDAISWIRKQDSIAFDVETDSLIITKISCSIFAVSNDKEGLCFVAAHSQSSNISNQNIKRIFNEILSRKIIIGHNLQFDLRVLLGSICDNDWELCREKINSIKYVIDTYWAAFYLNQERDGGNGLKNLSKIILGKKPSTFAQVTSGESIFNSDLIKLSEYCLEDCLNSYNLAKIFMEQLKNWDILSVFKNQKMPLLKILLKMGMRGVLLDRELLLNSKSLLEEADQFLISEIGGLCPELTKELWKKKDGKFQVKYPLDSGKQLGKYLFSPVEEGGLGLPMFLPRTPGGLEDVSADHLGLLQTYHPVIKHILDRREIKKIKSTYLDNQESFASPSWKLYSNWNGARARTGRLACSDPNLMNWPSSGLKLANGTVINTRNFVIPNPGKVFWIADYSQLELRLLAHLSNEETFIRAFTEKLDPHMMIAGKMKGLNSLHFLMERVGSFQTTGTQEQEDYKNYFFKAKDQIEHLTEEILSSSSLDFKAAKKEASSKILSPILGPTWEESWKFANEVRTKAKTVIYGILYGATPIRISSELKCSVEEAADLIDMIFDSIPNVRNSIQETHAEVFGRGYVRTSLGSIRFLNGYNSNNIAKREACCREGFNFKMQGFGMEVITFAMIGIDSDAMFRSSSSDIIIQVHDELIAEIPENWEKEFPGLPHRMRDIMMDPVPGFKFRVPLEVDWKIKSRWSK